MELGDLAGVVARRGSCADRSFVSRLVSSAMRSACTAAEIESPLPSASAKIRKRSVNEFDAGDVWYGR